MHTISLSDPIYVEAQRAAAASGLSVEAYVEEALRLHIQDDAPIILTPEQVALITQAEADIDAGKGLTMEQVRAELAANRVAWQAAHPH